MKPQELVDLLEKQFDKFQLLDHNWDYYFRYIYEDTKIIYFMHFYMLNDNMAIIGTNSDSNIVKTYVENLLKLERL